WYDKPTGRWTTSDYYAKDLKLPGWAAEINAMKIPDKMRGKTWELSPEVKASGLTFETAKPGVPPGFGKSFPHQLPDDKAFYDTWTYTPFANDFVAQSAHQAVTNLGMGKDDVPDILTLNFSSNDYLGHRFGPNSPEVMQMSVDTDKAVSKILNDLQKNVTGGLSSVLFVLSADHGVVAVPEDLEARGIPGGRLSDEDETKKALAEKVGADALGMSDDGLIWFDHAKLALAGIDLAIAQRKAAELFRADPRVFRVYTKSELPMVPVSDWIDEAAHRGIDAERGWDVAVIYKPGVYMYGGTGTGHGSPWIYDASVPLVFAGSGMKRGRQTDATGPEDIAATVCAELGIIAPSGSIGKAVGLLP
ncbi:MAG: alkaline phosphatase family protein, partial [Armatimonadetes bacterium]|nr:alkaline phosphatase family protein [Armatimonadota bacterium]